MSSDLKACGLARKAVLGEGTYGKVFLASAHVEDFLQDTEFGRLVHKEQKEKEVVVKYSETGPLVDVVDDVYFRLILEISILKQYPHPRLFPVQGNLFYGDSKYPFCTKKGIGYIMPKAEGDFNKLGSKIKRQCYFDLISALAHLHFYGFAHCDLKPANALFRDGRGYLTDLGNGFIIDKSNGVLEDGVLFGPSYARTTYFYAAPEVYRDKNICLYSQAGDMWSIGIMLLEQFFKGGKALGSIPEHQAFYASFSSFEIDPNPQLSKEENEQVLDLISRLLRVKPSERLDAQSALLHPFFKGLAFEYGSRNVSSVPRKVNENLMRYAVQNVSKFSILFTSLPKYDWVLDVIDYLYHLQEHVNPKNDKEANLLILSASYIILSLYGAELKTQLSGSLASIYSRIPELINLSKTFPLRKSLKHGVKTEAELSFLYQEYYCAPSKYWQFLKSPLPVSISKEELEKQGSLQKLFRLQARSQDLL